MAPRPTPVFPDMRDNYTNTVLIPAQQAQAAAEAQQAAEVAQQAQVSYSAPSVAVSGSCASWLAGAGVSDIADAMVVINAESGCNPNAVNASSGACGIGQALPCSKMPCSLGDGACQVIWTNGYVMGTYGSWANAAAHERGSGWY